MQYEVLYDVLQKVFDSWVSLLAGVLALSADLFLLLPLNRLRCANALRIRAQMRTAIPKTGVAVIAVFGIVMLGVALHDYLHLRDLRELARVGPLIVVEGALTETNSWVQTKTWRESLRLGNIKFQYADNETITPFPLLRGTRALAKSMRVRLTHVNGTLVKVEGPLCRAFKYCEVTEIFGVRTERRR